MIGALAPFLLLPSLNYYLTALAAALLVALWCIRWIGRGVITQRTPFDPFILALMLMIPIGIWASPLLIVSIGATTRLLWGIALYYALINSLTREQALRWSMRVALVAGVVIALISLVTSKGVMQSEGLQDKISFLTPIYRILPDWSHLLGPLVAEQDSSPGAFHPNVVGSTLAILIPIVTMVFAVAQRRVERMLSGSGMVIMIGALILTQSRLAMLALAAATLVAFLSYRWQLRRSMLVTVVVVGIVVVIALVGSGEVLSVFENQFASTGLDSWEVRMRIWHNGLRSLGDFAFTGIGLAVFYPVSTYIYSFETASRWAFGHAHNIFLQTGADLGVVGLISLIALLFGALWLGWPSQHANRTVLDKLRVGTWASVLVYILFGLFDALPLWTKSGFIFWVLLAWAVIGWRADRLAQQEVVIEV